MKLKFKKPVVRSKKPKRPVITILRKVLAKNTEPFVKYLAPSCMLILDRGYEDVVEGELIQFRWKDKSLGVDGKVKLPPDYPMVPYTERTFLRMRTNHAMIAKYKEETKNATLGHREAVKAKVAPTKKLKIVLGGKKKKGVVAVIGSKKPKFKLKMKGAK